MLALRKVPEMLRPMPFHPPKQWLPVAAVPLAVGAVMTWLLLFFAGQKGGGVALPGAEGATVDGRTKI